MEQLPPGLNLLFILTTLITLWLISKAANYSKRAFILIILWLVLQSVISLNGFYAVTNTVPPRFALLILPPVALILALFFTRKGRSFIDSLDVKTLTLLHVVRVPVEFTLYWLFLEKVVPGIMTFEGRNFDILCGITAPFVYYFGYVKNVMGRSLLMAWNIVCLLLLANIVVTAILSAPFPIQQFAFDQPNIALLYFPFVWLPCFIVPAVLFSHLVCIRRLVKK